MKLGPIEKYLLISTIAVMAGASNGVHAQVSSTNMENALMAEGLTQQRAQEILGTSVPVGTIIPYCLGTSNLPPNWRVCDGAIVTNAQQGPFVGKPVPDLRGQFLFGAISATTVGTKGGTNLTYSGISASTNGAHSHTANEHTHPMPALTGRVSVDTGGTYLLAPFQAVNDGGNTIGWARFVSDPVDPNSNSSHEGQHRHYLHGSTEGASDRGTDSTGNHSHTVNDFQAKLPPYTEVLYIVRIY